MRKTVLRPQDHAGYARAVIVESPQYEHVSMAGVIATDEAGLVVGEGDMAAQTRQIYDNIAGHLQELGGGLEDVIRHRVFVTTMDDDAINGYHAAHTEYFEEPARFPAGTLVEIDSLVLEEAMVEIEIEAIIPDDGWETTVRRPDER